MSNFNGRKILILGNVNSLHLQGFIEHVIKPLGFSVSAFCNEISQEGVSNQIAFAKTSDIKIYDSKRLIRMAFCDFIKQKLHLRKLAIALKGFMEVVHASIHKCFHKYDLINVQFVDLWALKLATRLKRKGTKLVLSYWGSDLLRLSDEELEKRWQYVRQFDYVTTDSIDLEERLLAVYEKKGDLCSNRARICFGSNVALCIDSALSNNKRNIGGNDISPETIVVSIGYNAGRAQQHLEVVRALGKLGDEIKNKLLVILQMTYLKEQDNYSELVVQECHLQGFKTIQLENYLSSAEVADIRTATDIFINAQTTDAFCSTIKEYFYANATVFNAKWLEYKEIPMLGLKVYTFERFDELSEMLEKYNRDNEKDICKKNRQIIKKEFTWDNCKKQWEKVYDFLLEN